MLTKLLAILFKTDYAEYKAHPAHAVFYPLLMIAAGGFSIVAYQWNLLGVICCCLGILLSVIVSLAIGWEKATSYWETINQHIALLMKVKDPEIFQHLGYKKLPSTVTIYEDHRDKHGLGNISVKNNVPVTAATMNQIANKVIMSRKLEFTQQLYGALVPNWRKFHEYMKEQQYIIPKNKKNVKNGYVLNRKGINLMYEYADEMIKLEVKKGGNNAPEK